MTMIKQALKEFKNKEVSRVAERAKTTVIDALQRYADAGQDGTVRPFAPIATKPVINDALDKMLSQNKCGRSL